MTVLITDLGEHAVDAQLRLTPAELLASTGWELKPEGLCRGDICVSARHRADVLVDDRVDLRVVAELLQRPLAIDDATGHVALGESAAARGEQLSSCEVGDLEVRDFTGEPFAWRAIGRKKKVLVTWASW